MTLVDELRTRQGAKTQDQFAAELRIDQSSLSRIYAGERKIGPKVASKIRVRFPELAFTLADFLMSSDMTTEHNNIPLEHVSASHKNHRENQPSNSENE